MCSMDFDGDDILGLEEFELILFLHNIQYQL
jgi:hypothetical protein